MTPRYSAASSTVSHRFGAPALCSRAAEEPDGQALYWAIYAEETPVGFVMIADEVGSPEYIAHYLWKLLIDERYQRRGFGTATFDLIVEYFRNRGVGTMWTSVGQGEGSPVTFYERYGFKRTGDLHSNETLLRLEIDLLAPARPTSRRASTQRKRPCLRQFGNVPRTNGGPADRVSSPLTFGV